MHRRISIVALLAAGAFQAPAALCMQWQFTTGAEYSSGEYGELTSTQAMLVPFSAKFTFGALSLRASVPYLLVRGPANVAPIIEDDGGSRSSNSGSGGGGGSSGSGGGNDGGDDDEDDDAPPFADDREAHGFGDATLSATWSWNDLFATRLYADFTARVRLPTGSERKGLGNGATDYATIAEIGWDGGKGGVFISGGRRMLESTATVVRVDGWQASAGYWRNIGPRSVFGMQGNWREAASLTGEDPRSVDVFLARQLSRGWKLEASGSAGFSDASPDYSAGLNFIWRSARR